MLLQKLLRLPAFALEQPIEIAALQAHLQLLPAIVANLLSHHRTGGVELGAQTRLGIVQLDPLLHDIIAQSLGNGLGQKVQPWRAEIQTRTATPSSSRWICGSKPSIRSILLYTSSIGNSSAPISPST